MNSINKNTEIEIKKKRERTGSRGRYTAAFCLLFALLLILLACNFGIGSIRIPLEDMLAGLRGRAIESTYENILWQIRMPRALAAAILGGALGLSGYLLQTFFHNPIAGPFVLGISSGAKLAVALVMVLLLGNRIRVGSGTMILAAFAGAFLSMGFVLIMSGKVNSMSMLVVCGVMIGYICSAITDFVVTFASDSDIVNLHNWSLGSFSGMSWSNVQVAATVVVTTVIITFCMSKPIGAFQLGENYAQSMGVNIKVFRALLILLSSVLSACVTAFAGPISFVGIAVPFIARACLGTSKPLIVIPGSFITGAVFCMICDLIARTAFAPVELSISTVTSIFGAPIVIYMMIRKNSRV